MASPLEGVVVLAIEQAVAAPFCTARLADAGARVIKIERPEGDFARGYDDVAKGQSSYFLWLNRGKESVILDLRREADRVVLEALLEDADILVQNLKPGALSRLGLAVETLRARHPRLICCSISGYGDNGPYAQRKAYDLLIQADSGLASITGSAAEPGRVGISVVDIATGATAHAALLEALIARGRTGQGADIRISMFDVMADWMTVPLLHAEARKPPQRVGLAHPSIAPYGVFDSADGRPLLISIQSDREWRVLCETVIDQPEMAVDPRFDTNVARIRNRADTDDVVAGAFRRFDLNTLAPLLEKADIAFALINDLTGLASHPHLRRIMIDTPEGEVACPAPAPLFDGEVRAARRVPALGVDSQTVLAGLTSRARS